MMEYPRYFKLIQMPEKEFLDFLTSIGLWIVVYIPLVNIFGYFFNELGFIIGFVIGLIMIPKIRHRFITTRVFITAEATEMTIEGTRKGFGKKLTTKIIEWKDLAQFKYIYPTDGPEFVFLVLKDDRWIKLYGDKLESFYQFLRSQCPEKEQIKKYN